MSVFCHVECGIINQSLNSRPQAFALTCISQMDQSTITGLKILSKTKHLYCNTKPLPTQGALGPALTEIKIAFFNVSCCSRLFQSVGQPWFCSLIIWKKLVRNFYSELGIRFILYVSVKLSP